MHLSDWKLVVQRHAARWVSILGGRPHGRMHGWAPRLATSLLLGMLAAVCTGGALAQSPKVMRIIVPFAPGGGQEILARTFAGELGVALGQTVIIENKPGAGGAVGSAFVAKAAADGQTLVMAAPSHIVSSLIATKPPYDPLRDFSAVAHIGRSAGQVLLVNARFPATTLAEFVKSVKASPGAYNYGSAGGGSSSHLAMAYFAGVAGLQMLHVPYKSNAEPVIEMIAGRIQFGFLPVLSAVAYANDPRVRMIATTSSERWPLLAQLPTFAETFPGFEFQSWFGLLGPAAVPRSVIDRINGEVGRLLKNPAVAERIAKLGIEPHGLAPEMFERTLREDHGRIVHILKQPGVVAD